MKNHLKSEWLRLLLIAIYMVVVIHCAIIGNTLALIGWGTGTVILIVGSIASHFFYRAAAESVEEARNTVVIEIHND